MEEKNFNTNFKENQIFKDTQIKGDIHTKQGISIHQGVLIQGDVVCDELYLNGTITGNVQVTHNTTLGTQALIEGRLVTATLEIASGASIKKGLKLQKPTTPKS